jgi:5'-phosphate synthase pdxT subunit
VKAVTVGVLALQGDYEAHCAMLGRLEGVTPALVRTPEELSDADGLIIPGGESTTIGKLLVRVGLMDPIRGRASEGMPVYGTCAGMILMARDIVGSDQPRLGIMDITVARNAFGRQIDSFEADIPAPAFGDQPLRGVFIRAPYVTETGPGVEVLARFEEVIVAVRQGHLLATAFHPELTSDTRVHEAFVASCRKAGVGLPKSGRARPAVE